MTEEITIPSIPLLDHQKEVFNKIIYDNIDRAILIWHRRAGKDLISFIILSTIAIENTGLYWYIFPYYTQCRKSFWEAFVNQNMRYIDLIPRKLVKKINNQEMKIELINGSIIRFVGADNYDSLVGSNPNGVVISEYALIKPSLWELVIEPIIIRNKGKVIFNSTPRGENHCYEMYNYLKNSKKSNHYASLLTIKDTGLVSEEEIQEMRRSGRPEALIQQEFYCSFQGANVGNYYNDIISNIADTNILENITYDGQDSVCTFWDLGVSDSMAIWFANLKNNKITVYDYYEANGYGLGHYVDYINMKKYKYYKHFLPHDGSHRQLTTSEKAQSIQNQLLQLGLENVEVQKRTNDVYSDIQLVRSNLKKCYFDKSKCKAGIQSLKNYRREYDENRNCYKETPLHDWSSHGADAFRLLVKVYQDKFSNMNFNNSNNNYKPIICKIQF